MLSDSISILEGSKIINFTLASGSSYPSSPAVGELFFNTTLGTLTVYDGSSWGAVGGGGAAESLANMQHDTPSLLEFEQERLQLLTKK